MSVSDPDGENSVPEMRGNVVQQMPPSGQEDVISRRLIDARMTATALPCFPGDLPETLAQAYAIQMASIARWRDDVAGWKVGLLSPADSEYFSAERLIGPIFASHVHSIEPASTKVMPIFEGGFAAVEAEFVLELGVAVQPSGRDYTNEELADIVSAMYAGAEIASSPMADINRLGPTVVVSDFGNNAGLLLGPKVPDWHARPLDSLVARVTVDNVVVGNASADAIPGGPLQALRFVIGLAAARGLELPAGTLVSTGASTGIHEVELSSVARVDFGALGWFDVTFESMTPAQ